MKTYKDILEKKVKFKKGDKVISFDTGAKGKINSISGDKSIITIAWSNGDEFEYRSDELEDTNEKGFKFEI